MIQYWQARKPEAFEKCLKLVLAHEGGYSNNPKDPGGPTNRGITQKVYDSYRSSKGLPPRSVEFIDDDETSEIYANQYWNKVGAGYLPPGLDYAAFDYSVNSGVSKAVKDLQKCVGATVDGIVGVETIDQICSAYKLNPQGLIQRYCQMRLEYLRTLSTWKTFGKGWTRRIVGDEDGFQAGDHGVIDFALMMMDDQDSGLTSATPTAIGSKTGEQAGKAPEKDISALKTPGGIAAATITAGLSGQTVFAFIDQVQPYINDTRLGKLALTLFLSLIAVGAGIFIYEYVERRAGRIG